MEPAKSDQTSDNEPQAVVVRKESERDIYVWSAPARPFKRRDRQFYVTTFAITGIVSLILLFAEGPMPVLLIVSLVFLYYVLSTVEPENVEYKISNKGIKIAGKLTSWSYLTRFWFSKSLDSDMLVLETTLIPGRIEMVIKPDSKSILKKEISAYIPFEELPSTGLDKATDWLTSKMHGNK